MKAMPMSQSSTNPNLEYDGGLFLRCPKAMPQAIKRAARNRMTSAAAYVRGAILKELQIDGHNLTPEDNSDG